MCELIAPARRCGQLVLGLSSEGQCPDPALCLPRHLLFAGTCRLTDRSLFPNRPPPCSGRSYTSTSSFISKVTHCPWSPQTPGSFLVTPGLSWIGGSLAVRGLQEPGNDQDSLEKSGEGKWPLVPVHRTSWAPSSGRCLSLRSSEAARSGQSHERRASMPNDSPQRPGTKGLGLPGGPCARWRAGLTSHPSVPRSSSSSNRQVGHGPWPPWEDGPREEPATPGPARDPHRYGCRAERAGLGGLALQADCPAPALGSLMSEPVPRPQKPLE